MKKIISILFAFVTVLSIDAFAAWTVVSDGTNPQVTDGNWVIQLNSKYKAKFVSKSGTSTVLDMSTLNSDLAAAGVTYVCTEMDNLGFAGESFSQLKTDLTEVYLPDEVVKIGEKCFHNSAALTLVELGTSFTTFSSSHVFYGCSALATIYTRGETPVVGTVKLPSVVTSLPGYTFYSVRAMKKFIAPGVKSIGQGTFHACSGVESIELSPDIYSVYCGKDHGTFYFCSSLSTLSPSKMKLTESVGQSAFREIPLTHDLDFSESTFTYVANNSFYGIALPNDKKIILPATLNSVGANAFRQQQNGKTLYVNLRFLGEVPVTLGTDCFTPKSQSTPNVLYVDAKKCPSWTATLFTPLTEEMKQEASYPGEGTLGKTMLGVNSYQWPNWLVQEDLPKGPAEWNIVSENNDGSITIYNTVDTWTFKLIPDGNGGYLVKYVSDELPADAKVELELVKISDDLEIELAGLADEAFKGVTKISELVIPTGADFMGEYALQGCSSLTKVILPVGLDFDNVGKGAFSGCSSLSILGYSTQVIKAGEVVLFDDVTTIVEELFAGCSSIVSITGKGVDTIEASAFLNASSLAKVVFSDELGSLTLGEAAFKGTALTQTIDFTNTKSTTIAASVFENCRGITLIKIPATVTSIGANAFANIGDGANIDFAGVVPTLGADCLTPPADAAGSRYIIRVQFDNLENWVSSGFTSINDSMKAEEDYMGKIYVGQTTLGTDGSANWVFCKDPNQIWWIKGKGTYSNKSTDIVTDGNWELHVYVDNNVTNIAPIVSVANGTLDMTTLNTDTELYPSRFVKSAFEAYKGGPAIVKLPDSFTQLGERVFYQNKEISEVEFNVGIPALGGSQNFYESTIFTTYLRGGERVEGRVLIPETITSIPNHTFNNSDSYLELIARGAVSIGQNAFYHSSSVTNIELSVDVHTLSSGGNGIFYQCNSLKTISPSEMKLTTIGGDCFRELRLNHGFDFSKSTFTTVTYRSLYAIKCTDADGNACPIILPKTVTSLGEQAFWGQNGNGKQVIVFLGDKPTSISSKALDTNGNGIDTLVVDAEAYPAWIETNFIPAEEIPEAEVTELIQRLSKIPNFPGNLSKVLGKSTLGTAEKYANWVVQLARPATMIIIR